MVTRALFVVFIAAAVCAIFACSKTSEAPAVRSAAEAKAERDASAAKARESAVFGDQLKAMDKAQATANEAAKATEDRLKAIETK